MACDVIIFMIRYLVNGGQGVEQVSVSVDFNVPLDI